MKERRLAVFETNHPVVPALYTLFALVFTMASMQPVLIGIALAGAFACNCCARGVRATCAGLRWQLPVICIIALFNPLFSASGSTVLFRLGERAVYLESLAYGLAMGGLFVASALWCMAAAHMLTFDKAMTLLGNAAPTVSLMICGTMRLIPRFVRRGHQVLAAQHAAGMPGSGADEVRDRLRLSSVLMGWGMEDSLETADAMRARGWQAGVRRTSYTRYRFCDADAVAVVLIVLAAALCAVVAWAATSQYTFYPTMSRLVAWWGYIPYAAWMFFPACAHVINMRRFS